MFIEKKVTTVTWKYDKEGNKKLETETTSSLYKDTTTKATTNYLSVENKKDI